MDCSKSPVEETLERGEKTLMSARRPMQENSGILVGDCVRNELSRNRRIINP
jgi:hypothetical protein